MEKEYNMSAEQLSQNEVNALLEDDTLFPDYGDVPQKEIITSLVRNIPQYLKEGLSHFSDTRIGLSHFQISIKGQDEILKDMTSSAVIFSQAFKDPRFEGQFTIVVKEDVALKVAKTFLGYPELNLTVRAIRELEDAFRRFSDALFSLIESDYGKALPLDILNAEQVTNPQESFNKDTTYLEMTFSMTLASVNCPIYILMPVYFAGSLSKLIEEKSNRQNTNIKSTRPVQFSQLDTSREHTGENSKIDVLLDVSMQLTAELGRTRIKVRDILSLGEGSILELQKLAGEAIDVLVNGKVIAHGEVVVIDEYFGVRLTEILAPKEIIPTLKAGSS